MTLRTLGALTLFAVLAAACDTGTTRDAKSEPSAQPAKSDGTKSYGDPLKPARAVALSEVLAAPDDYAGKTVTVEGRVRRACRKKGCWMEIAESMDEGNQGARVTFKDYGFFVPTDSAGSAATVQGVVSVKKVEPGEVKHLESDGAHFAKKYDDGSAREIRLEATGVQLKNAS